MGEIIQRLLETFTGPVLYLIIFGSLLAESTVILGFLAPGISALVFGAFVAGTGHLSPGLVWLAGFLAVVLGDNIGYVLGRYAKRSPRIQGWLKKAGIKESDPQPRTKYLVFYQFLVVTRAPMPIFLGLKKMSFGSWIVLNIVASVMFVSAFFAAGYVGGRVIGSLDKTQHFVKLLERGLIIFGIAIVVGFTIRWYLQRRQRQPSDSELPDQKS